MLSQFVDGEWHTIIVNTCIFSEHCSLPCCHVLEQQLLGQSGRDKEKAKGVHALTKQGKT